MCVLLADTTPWEAFMKATQFPLLLCGEYQLMMFVAKEAWNVSSLIKYNIISQFTEFTELLGERWWRMDSFQLFLFLTAQQSHSSIVSAWRPWLQNKVMKVEIKSYPTTLILKRPWAPISKEVLTALVPFTNLFVFLLGEQLGNGADLHTQRNL